MPISYLRYDLVLRASSRRHYIPPLLAFGFQAKRELDIRGRMPIRRCLPCLRFGIDDDLESRNAQWLRVRSEAPRILLPIIQREICTDNL